MRNSVYKTYLKIALRTLLRHKGYSFINIAGLSIGMASALLILLYVWHETSYDQFHENKENIYRVILHGRFNDNEMHSAHTNPPMASTMVSEFPEVLRSARLYKAPAGDMTVGRGENKFIEKNYFYADSNLFDIFSIPFIAGEPSTSLTSPNSVVITERIAKKYFGDENPIGNVLTFNDVEDYKVTGVVKELPAASHWHFDLLASMMSLPVSRSTQWMNAFLYSYVVLENGASPEQVEAKFPALIKKYMGASISAFVGMSYDEFSAAGNGPRFALQPIQDIHLHSELSQEIEPNGNILYVYIFSIIVLFIIVIASINFMNLASARSINRGKEVGIRKVLGSDRKQLVNQFLMESVMMSLISFLLAIALVELLLPLFDNVTGINLPTLPWNNFYFLGGLISMVIIIGIFAGSYPAFVLSSFKPVDTLKGFSKGGVKGGKLRSSLVVFQFAISIILIVGTLIVNDQLEYVQNEQLGFDKEQVLVIPRIGEVGSQIESFKRQLLNDPNIVSASVSSSLPGIENFNNWIFKEVGSSTDDSRAMNQFFADPDYLSTMKINIIDGRLPSREIPSDTNAIVLNAAAVKDFGWDNPIGKQMEMTLPSAQYTATVVGVTENYNYESLHQEIQPLVMALRYRPVYLSVRIGSSNVKRTIDYINEQWDGFTNSKPFEYSFLDEDFNRLYQSEELTGRLFSIFSIIAIFIASLGLFGLASFTAQQRTKEIGVRKVLGATVGSVVALLSKDFLKLVAISTLIAWPIAYYVMSLWLQDFAYKVDIGISTLLSASIFALLIAILTVSYQAFKAAMSNPVESLKYE